MRAPTILDFARGFPGVTDAALAPFARKIRRRSIEKGQKLLRAGDPCTYISYVREGLFKLQGANSRGRPYIVAFATTGSFVSDYTSMIAGEPARFDIEAVEDSVIESLAFDDYRRMADLGKPFDAIIRATLETLIVQLARREWSLLTLSASERYAVFLREMRDILPRLTRQDIALYLGITPVSLSRLSANLRRARLSGA